MVLPKKLIPPVQEFYPLKIDANTPKDDICKETTQHAMAGLLTQLDFLAEYATSLFSGLVKEANETAAQLKNLTSRAAELQAILPQLEEMYQGTALEVFHTYERVNYSAANPQQHQHLTNDSFPDALRSVYDTECTAPPKLDVFDEYFPDDKKSLQLYTNPEFFIEQWIQEQMKLQAEAKKARKARRAQRKKQKKPETVAMKKKPTKLERVRYDPVTGEKITAKIAASDKKAEPSKPTQRINVAVASVEVPQEPVVQQPPSAHVPSIAVTPAAAAPSNNNNNNNHAAPPASNVEESPRSKKEKKSSHGKHHRKEKKSSSSSGGGANDAPPVPSTHAPPLPQSGPPATPSTRPPPKPRSRSPSPSPRAAVPSTPPPPMPPAAAVAPPPSAIAAPPPPMPSTKLSAAAPRPSGGLLGQIAQGRTLKKVEPQEKPVAKDGHSALLSQIQRGAALKKAEDRKLAPKQADDAPLSVADILARRIAIIGNDKADDDSSDSGDDWDDDDWD